MPPPVLRLAGFRLTEAPRDSARPSPLACEWRSLLGPFVGALASRPAPGPRCALLTLAARPLFLTYVGRLASYSHIYGWLAIGIILLVWTEIVAIITLFGGELASHIQMMAYEGLSGAEVSRRHRPRSPDRAGQG